MMSLDGRQDSPSDRLSAFANGSRHNGAHMRAVVDMNVSNTGRELEYAFTRLSCIIFLLPALRPGYGYTPRISLDVYAAETPVATT